MTADYRGLVTKWRKKAKRLSTVIAFDEDRTLEKCADELAEEIAKHQVSADWIRKAANELWSMYGRGHFNEELFVVDVAEVIARNVQPSPEFFGDCELTSHDFPDGHPFSKYCVKWSKRTEARPVQQPATEPDAGNEELCSICGQDEEAHKSHSYLESHPFAVNGEWKVKREALYARDFQRHVGKITQEKQFCLGWGVGFDAALALRDVPQGPDKCEEDFRAFYKSLYPSDDFLEAFKQAGGQFLNRRVNLLWIGWQGRGK